MKKFAISSRKVRCLVLLSIFVIFGLLLIGAALFEPIFWAVAAGWLAFSLMALWNTIRSVISGRVELDWDGSQLSVLEPSGQPKATITGADWVYVNPTSVVVRSQNSLARFNHGHVRSNGRELTIDGFHGSGLDEIGDTLKSLGPAKQWLWRHVTF